MILLGLQQIMLTTRFLILLLNLSLLKCASIEEQSEDIQTVTSKTPLKTDLLSRYLDEQLLHKVLQYDAKSAGRVCVASKGLLSLVTGSRTFRYFEGAGWDMPELANICEFGVTDTGNKPELKAELARIMAFSHIKDEVYFNETLTKLLLEDKVFKELAVPVLKYLIRRYFERKDYVTDEWGFKGREYLEFAVENRFYDVFFEMGKDPGVWKNITLDQIIGKEKQLDSFYFDCYNNYVFGNCIASEFMFDKMKN